MSDEILNRVLATMIEVRTQITSLQTEMASLRDSLRAEIKERFDELRAGDPSEQPGVGGDIRRTLSAIRTLQLDAVAIKTEQTSLRIDLMAQLDPNTAAKKVGENVRERLESLDETVGALTRIVRRLQTRMDQLEEGRGEGSL